MATIEDNLFGHNMIRWLHSEGVRDKWKPLPEVSVSSLGRRRRKQAIQALATTAMLVGSTSALQAALHNTTQQSWARFQESIRNLAQRK